MTLQLITSLLKVHIQQNCISCLGTLICCNDRILLLWKVQKTISIQKCCLYTYYHSRIGWLLYSIWLKAYYNFNRNAVKVRLIKEKVCYKAHNIDLHSNHKLSLFNSFEPIYSSVTYLFHKTQINTLLEHFLSHKDQLALFAYEVFLMHR